MMGLHPIRWAIVASFVGGLALALPGAALAGTENSFKRGFDSGSDIRTLRSLETERLQQRWRSQARERAAIRQNRIPVYRQPALPTDRVSQRLWRSYPPLGHLPRRYDNNADVTREVFIPPRDRIVPKGLTRFERRLEQRRSFSEELDERRFR